jgi:hypothetical protein
MSAVLPPPFDYAQLKISAQVIASEAAANIRAHGKLATQSIIAIGAELTKVKEAIGHGSYLAWINTEFGWSDRTARNYVRAYEAFKSETVSDLEPIDTKALYLLAAPSTPKPVRKVALEKAVGGERVTYGAVKALLQDERDQDGPTAEPRPDSFSEKVERYFAQDENVSALAEAAPDLGLKVKAGEMKAVDAWREIAAREEEQEEEKEEDATEKEEVDDTKFILEHIKVAYELVDYYSNCKPQEIAGFIDPARRSSALAKKTKRLGNWFKELSRWLERS